MSRPTSNKTDAERRLKQAAHFARIIRVHHQLGGRDPSTEDVRQIAKALGVVERTIYRDVAVLRIVYESIGSRQLDTPHHQRGQQG